MFIDEEVHIVIFEDTIEVDFFEFIVGYFAVSWEIVFLPHVLDISLDEIIQLLLVLPKDIEAVLHFSEQKLRDFDIDFID